MNRFAQIAILFLAMYAHGASAESEGFLILSQQQNLAHSEIHSVKPAWSIIKTEEGSQLVGFANFNQVHNLNNRSTTRNQGFGLGFYQQHTSWFHSQLLVQQHPLLPNRVQSLMEWMVGF